MTERQSILREVHKNPTQLQLRVESCIGLINLIFTKLEPFKGRIYGPAMCSVGFYASSEGALS